MLPKLSWKVILVLSTAAIFVPIICLLAAPEPRNSPNLPLREAMIRVLGSVNPSPSLGEEAQTFDRLIGSWEADFGFPQPDGSVRHKKGELHFGWVMDGHAVQDLWICGLATRLAKRRSARSARRFASLIRS
jgi:hypothetical protein